MLLALTLVSSRGLTSPTAPVFASPLRCAGVRCSDPERKAVFSEERSESVKAGGIASLTGTMASAPVKASAVLATLPVKATALASWQISTCVFAVQLFLFGIVYRCTVRCDDNDALRQGAVGAAALCRALGLMQTNNAWTGDMWLQLGLSFGESALAFGAPPLPRPAAAVHLLPASHTALLIPGRAACRCNDSFPLYIQRV